MHQCWSITAVMVPPLTTKRRFKAGGPQAYSAKRQGRESDEFLFQHAFYRRQDALGQVYTEVVLRDPLPMTQGKSALAIFSAGQESSRMLGNLGIGALVRVTMPWTGPCSALCRRSVSKPT